MLRYNKYRLRGLPHGTGWFNGGRMFSDDFNITEFDNALLLENEANRVLFVDYKIEKDRTTDLGTEYYTVEGYRIDLLWGKKSEFVSLKNLQLIKE